MKQKINFSQFTDAFRDSGREDSFSYNGLRALYDWLEAYDEDAGTETEFDVIAICCDFTEYENVEEYINDHPISLDICPNCGEGLVQDHGEKCPDCEQNLFELKDYIDDISNNTIVIPVDSETFIIQAF